MITIQRMIWMNKNLSLSFENQELTYITFQLLKSSDGSVAVDGSKRSERCWAVLLNCFVVECECHLLLIEKGAVLYWQLDYCLQFQLPTISVTYYFRLCLENSFPMSWIYDRNVSISHWIYCESIKTQLYNIRNYSCSSQDLGFPCRKHIKTAYGDKPKGREA